MDRYKRNHYIKWVVIHNQIVMVETKLNLNQICPIMQKKSYLIGAAKKVGLASLKSDIDKLDTGKLETGHADLNKLSKCTA